MKEWILILAAVLLLAVPAAAAELPEEWVQGFVPCWGPSWFPA